MKNRQQQQINPNFFNPARKNEETLIQSNSNNVIMKKLEQCKKTGVLNLSSLNPPLEEIPKELFNMYFNFSESDKFWELETLKSLDFSFNQLTDLPKELLLFNDIQTVKIKNNKLASFFPMLHDGEENFHTFFQNLRILDLSFNQISDINNEILFHSMFNLKDFNVSNNLLQRIPDGIWHLNQLRTLDLSCNHLSALFSSPSIARQLNISLLTVLNLSKNRLTEFSGELLNHCKLLESLDLSQNVLNSFPPIRVNRSLKYLNLSQNRLRSFPSIEISLTQLNQLILSFNQISSWGDPIITLEHIKDGVSEILLSNNNLSNIPPEIEVMGKLKVLDVSNNNLNDLPHTLGYINSLQIIKLEGNCIKSIRQTLLVKPSEEIKKYLRTRGESLFQQSDPFAAPVNAAPNTMMNSHSRDDSLQMGGHSNFGGEKAPVKGPSRSSAAPVVVASTSNSPLLALLTSRIYEITSKNNLLNLSSCSLSSAILDRYPLLDNFYSSQPLISTVTRIDLSNNDLTEYPLSLISELAQDFHLSTIQAVNLSKNKLSSMRGGRDGMKSMGKDEEARMQRIYSQFALDVSENSLRLNQLEMILLSQFQFSFGCIHSLVLHHNPLMQLSSLFNELHSLTKLELAFCQLTSFNSFQIENFPSLKYLDISNNKISGLPNNFYLATALEFLSLENNEFTTIPSYLGILPNLKTLLIQGNPQKLIRPAIISQGSAKVIEYLKCRHEPSSLPATAMTGRTVQSSLSSSFHGKDEQPPPKNVFAFEKSEMSHQGRTRQPNPQTLSSYYSEEPGPHDSRQGYQPTGRFEEDRGSSEQDTAANPSRDQRSSALKKFNSRKLLNYSSK
jgi:Leucine-rich repeat (LRR) protein